MLIFIFIFVFFNGLIIHNREIPVIQHLKDRKNVEREIKLIRTLDIAGSGSGPGEEPDDHKYRCSTNRQ